MTTKSWIMAAVSAAVVVGGFSMNSYAAGLFPGGMGRMYRTNMLLNWDSAGEQGAEFT